MEREFKAWIFMMFLIIIMFAALMTFAEPYPTFEENAEKCRQMAVAMTKICP
jgi:hypothetical protein